MGAACSVCRGTGVFEDAECPKCVGGDKDFVVPEAEPRKADEDTYETLEGFEKFVSEEEPEVDPTGSPTDEPSESPEPSDSGTSEATPAAEEAAREAGVDLSEVEGTGKDGRVLKSDVEAAVTEDESVEPEVGQDA